MANLTITKFQENNVELKREGCKNDISDTMCYNMYSVYIDNITGTI